MSRKHQINVLFKMFFKVDACRRSRGGRIFIGRLIVSVIKIMERLHCFEHLWPILKLANICKTIQTWGKMHYLGSLQKLIESLAGLISIPHFHIDETREAKLLKHGISPPTVHCVSQHSVKILEKHVLSWDSSGKASIFSHHASFNF